MDISYNTLYSALAEQVCAKLTENFKSLVNQPKVDTEYLTAPQVAKLTGFSVKALEAMRAKRTGPEYSKHGKAKNGPVRYALEDVRTWMGKNKEVAYAAS